MTARRHLILAALLAGAAACSNAPTAADGQDAVARGRAALEAGQPRIARVELLNAIKANPNNRAIRIVQAETYLALRDGIAAQAEVERARQLGAPIADTAHLMAHALLLQDDPSRALTEAGQAGPAHLPYAARMRGKALSALGDADAAAAAFDEALAAGPEDPQVWLDVAAFRRGNGDIAGALEMAGKALALDPRSTEALVLRGEITRGQYGLRGALPWFERALEIDPDNVPALLERAATLGELGQMGALLADTRKVLSISAGHPVAYYLQSMLAARAGKFELARSLHQRTGGKLDGQPAGMLLASAIDFQTGNMEQAAARLEKLVAMQPDNRKARRLLAAAYWRRGDAAATVRTLQPIVDRPDADSYALALAGKALARQGDPRASAYISRAAQPQAWGGALAEPGLSEEQLALLRSAASRRPNDASANIKLIAALLARGEVGEALALARGVQARNPGVPDAHVLVGDALLLQGNPSGAAEEYRKAANLAFTEPVALRLIEALQRASNHDAAMQVLNLFRHENPRNVPAQLLAANAFMRAGQWPSAIALYEGLRRRLGDRDAVMLNNLAWAYSQQGDWDRAIPLADKAWKLDRGNPVTADTLGWLLFKSGRNKAQGLALMQQAAMHAPSEGGIQRRWQ